jgi:hypothetical protein
MHCERVSISSRIGLRDSECAMVKDRNRKMPISEMTSSASHKVTLEYLKQHSILITVTDQISILMTLLSRKRLSSLSRGDDQDLVFDISRIEPRDFLPLITAIAHYSKNQIFSLTFTLDLYYEYCKNEYQWMKNASTQNNSKIPSALEHSAFFENPTSLQALTRMLCAVLPESVTLFTLNFRSILFGRTFSSFAPVFLTSHSLRSLSFVTCDLRDEGFALLARSLHRPGLNSLCCRQCGLTDQSIFPIVGLLLFYASLHHRSVRSHGLESPCLTSLDLQDNDFSTQLLLDIDDCLTTLPISLVDLRNNQEFDATRLREIQEAHPRTDIRANVSEKPPPKPCASHRGKEIVLAPGLKIGGDDAGRFVEMVSDLLGMTKKLYEVKTSRKVGGHRRRVRTVSNPRLCPFMVP